MGLDASVMCNCYRDGKSQPCPLPQYFVIDGDGFPALNLPYDASTEDKFEQFDEWLLDACDHPNMDFAAVFISNWKGYRSFLEALEQIGRDRFPTLLRELPEGNQGITSAEAARLALAELETFVTGDGSISKPFLIDSDSGEPVASSTMAYGGLFAANGRTGLSMGFDERGFFIIDTWELNREMFRALRFEQRILEADSLDRPPQYEFVDLDTERRFISSTPLKLFVRDGLGQLKQSYPRRVHVETRSVNAHYFAYIIEPLQYIFKAAVETGNPVRWS